MIAIDTNIIVRVLTNDHTGQAQLAKKLIAKHPVYVANTVLLETTWVLKYAYGFDKKQILTGLKNFFGLKEVKLESVQDVSQTLNWYEQGLEFADALHLATCTHIKQFATFDKKFLNRAQKLTIHKMIMPK